MGNNLGPVCRRMTFDTLVLLRCSARYADLELGFWVIPTGCEQHRGCVAALLLWWCDGSSHEALGCGLAQLVKAISTEV